jgi:hypothetical protein
VLKIDCQATMKGLAQEIIGELETALDQLSVVVEGLWG